MGNTGKRKSKNSVLGLDLGSHTIKAVEMIRNGSVLSIRNCSLVEANPSSYLDSLAAVIKVGAYRADSLAIAICGRGVFLQTVTISVDRADDMQDAIREAVAGLLPYDVNEAVLDYYLDANSHGRNISALAVGARRADILKKVRTAQAVGLNPGRVEVELVSLANAVEMACAGRKEFPPGTPLCLADFGASKTLIAVTDGVNRLFYEFPVGGNTLTEMIAHRLGCGFDEAEACKLSPSGKIDMVKDAVYPGLEDVTAEIRACIGWFRMGGGRETERVYLSGGLVGFPGVEGLIGRMLGKETQVFNPFESFATGNLDTEFLRLHAHRMAVAFGLACHADD